MSHTENKEKESKVQTITRKHSCQHLHGLPLVIRLFVQKAQPNDRTINVVFISFPGKQLPCTRNKTTYFYIHVFFSEFVLPLYHRIQVVLSCCKEYHNKNQQFLATSTYFNPTTYVNCDSVRTIPFSIALHLTIIKKTFTNHITKQYG